MADRRALDAEKGSQRIAATTVPRYVLVAMGWLGWNEEPENHV